MILHCFPTLTYKCPMGRFVALRLIYIYSDSREIWIDLMFVKSRRISKVYEGKFNINIKSPHTKN